MVAEVQVIEGGQLIRTEKMKLTLIKEFNDNTVLYENEAGRPVIHFREKDSYVLISIDMA